MGIAKIGFFSWLLQKTWKKKNMEINNLELGTKRSDSLH